jgi:hypothetical protein
MKFVVKDSNGTKRVIANVPFQNGAHVMSFHGTVYKQNHMPAWDQAGKSMQIGNGLYLGPSGKYDDFVRHSCNPNCGVVVGDKAMEPTMVRGRDGKLTMGSSWISPAQLIAIQEIQAGEELTWDFSTTTNDPNWNMECSCGAISCRGLIRGYQYLPRRISARYRIARVVPDYLVGG